MSKATARSRSVDYILKEKIGTRNGTRQWAVFGQFADVAEHFRRLELQNFPTGTYFRFYAF